MICVLEGPRKVECTGGKRSREVWRWGERGDVYEGRETIWMVLRDRMETLRLDGMGTGWVGNGKRDRRQKQSSIER